MIVDEVMCQHADRLICVKHRCQSLYNFTHKHGRITPAARAFPINKINMCVENHDG